MHPRGCRMHTRCYECTGCTIINKRDLYQIPRRPLRLPAAIIMPVSWLVARICPRSYNWLNEQAARLTGPFEIPSRILSFFLFHIPRYFFLLPRNSINIRLQTRDRETPECGQKIDFATKFMEARIAGFMEIVCEIILIRLRKLRS